jgi:DNA repair protein RadA/Sms
VDLAIVGEVGLSGEVRTVGQLPLRLSEAARIGFRRALIPRLRRGSADLPRGLELVEIRNLAEAMAIAMPE